MGWNNYSRSKQLKWDEITIPDQWKIEITQPPRNFEQKNISKIIEQKDGKILLRFGSYRDPLPPKISSYHSRASFSEYRTSQSSKFRNIKCKSKY